MSGAFGLGSRAYLGCLASVLFFAGMCSKLWAQDQSVGFSFQAPTLPEGQPSEDLNQIKQILQSSIAYALGPDFSIADDQTAASHRVDLQIIGPLKDCYWQVSCRWSSGAIRQKKCWDYPAAIPYCFPADIEKMSCLGQLADLGVADVPKLQGDLCEAARQAETAEEEYKTVYTSCLAFEVEDTTWRNRVGPLTLRVPLVIEDALDAEFKLRGYDIVPAANCKLDETPEEPQDSDLVIFGSIREDKTSEKIYVDLLVKINNELVPAGIRDVMRGRTDEMKRAEFVDSLANEIINYIRARWPKNE